MELTKEQIDFLAKFALDILDEWPDIGNFDGGDIQDIAVKHNILIPRIVYVRCGEECNCAEYYDEDEWQDGVTCYHIADWLDRAAELQRAPVQSEQGGQSSEAKCTTERLFPVHKIWHVTRPNRSDGG